MKQDPRQRVLHFAQDTCTSGFFPQLAKWHDRTRYEMHFATLNPMASWLRDYMESQGVSCFSCDCLGRSQYPLGMIRLARHLRHEHVDVLHTHLFEPSVIGLLAGVMARTGTRVMTRHHSDLHTRINKKWHVRCDQLCTRLSHAVIAVSSHTADHLVGIESAPRAKVHVVLNGIDFERVVVSSPNARQRIRQEAGAQNDYLLLIVARLHPDKGHHYLFKALPKIRARASKRVRLLVAGEGSFDRVYRETVRSIGCDEMVTFLGFRKDSPDLIAAADLVVLPTLAEAFGLVLTEALYLGTPVVATRVGAIPEIVDDGIDGVLIPPADSDALACAILELLENPESRLRLAGAGREKVLAKFRFEDMVRSYEGVYATAAAHRPSVAGRVPRSASAS